MKTVDQIMLGIAVTTILVFFVTVYNSNNNLHDLHLIDYSYGSTATSDRELLDREVAKIMDMADNLSTEERVDLCYYMLEVGYLKDSVNCLSYVSDEESFKDSLSTFAQLRALGLYPEEEADDEDEDEDDKEDNKKDKKKDIDKNED